MKKLNENIAIRVKIAVVDIDSNDEIKLKEETILLRNLYKAFRNADSCKSYLQANRMNFVCFKENIMLIVSVRIEDLVYLLIE